MRYLKVAALAASLLASAASASTVTYTITGTFNRDSPSFGPAATALRTALGPATTYEAVFVATSLDPTGQQQPETYEFRNMTVSLKLDGVLRYSGATGFSNFATVYTDETIQSVSFFSSITGDFAPDLAGLEMMGFNVSTFLPNNAVDSDSLPTTSFFPQILNSVAHVNLSNATSMVGRSDAMISSTSITSITVVSDVAPVPEPGEWAMMGVGLAVVGAAARRRRRG